MVFALQDHSRVVYHLDRGAGLVQQRIRSSIRGMPRVSLGRRDASFANYPVLILKLFDIDRSHLSGSLNHINHDPEIICMRLVPSAINSGPIQFPTGRFRRIRGLTRCSSVFGPRSVGVLLRLALPNIMMSWVFRIFGSARMCLMSTKPSIGATFQSKMMKS